MNLPSRIAAVCICFLVHLQGQDEARPSFLVVTVDSLRADRGPGGANSAVAPGLSRWGARGVRFSHAYTPTVITYPSLRSFLTGRYPDTFLIGPPVPPPRPLPALLRPLGYRTCFLSGLGVFSLEDPSLAEQCGTAFEEVRQDLGVAAMAEAAQRFIARAPGPWFLWLHVMEPHLPYRPPAGFARGDTSADLYDGEVRHVDSVIAPLLESVAERAWTVLSADHGEELPDEHGHIGHGKTLCESAVRIPLVIRGPGVEPRDVHTRVSAVDLFPTLLEIARVKSVAGVEGESLLDAIEGGRSDDLGERSGLFVETRIGNALAMVPHPVSAFLTTTGKVIKEAESAHFEAFDLAEDPEGRKSLFPQEAEKGDRLVARWRDALRRRMSRWSDDPKERETLQLLWGSRSDLTELLARTQSDAPGVREIAIRALANRPVARFKTGFAQLTESEDRIVSEWAAVALGRVSKPSEDWPVEVALGSGDPAVRSAALHSLMVRPLPRAAQILAAAPGGVRRPDWREVIVLNSCGHRRGLDLTRRLLAEKPLIVRGVEKVLADLVRCRRPEVPDVIEDHVPPLSRHPVLAVILGNISERFPSGQMLRIVIELERRAGPELARYLKVKESRLRIAIERCRREVRTLKEGASWQNSPPAVTWELAAGISFLNPASGALKLEEWNEPRPFLPVRSPRLAEAELRIPPSSGAVRQAALQLIAATEATIIIRFAGGGETRLVIGAGEGTYLFPLPESQLDAVLSLRIEGASPELVGFRELVLLP